MDIGARILLAIGLGALLLADMGCAKSRGDVGSTDRQGSGPAYHDAVEAHEAETGALNDMYQERFALLAEYRHELDVLADENHAWINGELQLIDAARRRSEEEYHQKLMDLRVRHNKHADESLKKQDAITDTYRPRVDAINERIDAQSKRVDVTRASLREARRRR